MKIFLTIISALLLNQILVAQRETSMVLEGHYQGVNLFIQNPYTPDGKSFCVNRVEINDSIVSVENNTSAFEIDLIALKLTIGDPVVIKIYHHIHCLPHVIYTHLPKPNVKFTNIEIVD